MHTRVDDIVCGEIGAPEAERWSAPISGAAPADVAAIESLAREGVVEVRDAARGREIAGTDRVGVVLLPSGRKLHVRPKVGGLVLFDWFAYLGECPPVSQWPGLTSGLAEGTDLHSMLAVLLVGELEKLTRAPLRRDYVTAREAHQTVRGRVAVGALARSCHRLPSVPQVRRVRSPDTPYNQVLAATLDRLPPLLPAGEGWRSRWTGLREDWARVGRDVSDLSRAAADARHACPPGYSAAVWLACLILFGGATPAAAATPPGGGAFLLSLSGLWERALRRLCGELHAETGWTPLGDADRTRRWHDGHGHGGHGPDGRGIDGRAHAQPARWMTADVLLQTSAGRRWVLDAKYKRDYGNEDRNDRFQATAYATAFGADRASLVYPTAAGGEVRWGVLLSARVGRARRVTVDSIELPMAAGPAACRAALLEVVRGRRRGRYEQLWLF
jgi:hypothetical protein